MTFDKEEEKDEFVANLEASSPKMTVEEREEEVAFILLQAEAEYRNTTYRWVV